jgi:exodeoxyribonuclease VII large subunit
MVRLLRDPVQPAVRPAVHPAVHPAGRGDGARPGSAEVVPAGALRPSELLDRARQNVEHINRHGPLTVVGELFDRKVGSNGHVNFVLKDEGAEAGLPAFMYRKTAMSLSFAADNGLRVVARGRVKVTSWAKVQLEVESLGLLGAGAFEAAFAALKDKLAKAGLFDVDKKVALPFLPRAVGIVTSPSGDALFDVFQRLRERSPKLHIVLAPTKVQGQEAPADIADAVRRLDRSGLVDVILLVRGGGSLEDLWAFNDEQVARAIAHARTPIISGIGHQQDTTIADLVADRRADTPTHAATLATAHVGEQTERVQELRRRASGKMQDHLRRAHLRLSKSKERLARARTVLVAPRRSVERSTEAMRALLKRRLADARARLHLLATRLDRAAPTRVLAEQRGRLLALSPRLQQQFERQRQHKRQRLALLITRLEALSPLSVLARGYAVVTDDNGRVLTEATNAHVGDRFHVRLRDGAIDVTVDQINVSQVDDPEVSPP